MDGANNPEGTYQVMPRTEHPVSEDAETLRHCSSGEDCVHGNVALPRTLKFFPVDSWMRDGMSVRCRKCLSAATMASRAKRKAKERGEGE